MAEKKEKMTLSNMITILRIVLVPFIFYFIYFDMQLPAFLFFAAAFFSDLLDGYLARKRNEVTSLGKLLDPVADKLTQGAAIFAILMRENYNYLIVLYLFGVFAYAFSYYYFAKKKMSVNLFGRVMLGIQILMITAMIFNIFLSRIFMLLLFLTFAVSFIHYAYRGIKE